jgi:hypothetical protein
MRCFLCSRVTLLPTIKDRGQKVSACWRHRNQGKIELQRKLARGGRYTHKKRI